MHCCHPTKSAATTYHVVTLLQLLCRTICLSRSFVHYHLCISSNLKNLFSQTFYPLYHIVLFYQYLKLHQSLKIIGHLSSFACPGLKCSAVQWLEYSLSIKTCSLARFCSKFMTVLHREGVCPFPRKINSNLPNVRCWKPALLQLVSKNREPY